MQPLYHFAPGSIDDFHYPKGSPNLIAAGSMALGNSAGYVVDAFYTIGGTRQSDWCWVDSIIRIMPPLWGSEITYRHVINDSNSSGKRVKATCHWLARGTRYYPGYDDFVIILYDYENLTDSIINSLYSGIFIDFDLGLQPVQN